MGECCGTEVKIQPICGQSVLKSTSWNVPFKPLKHTRQEKSAVSLRTRLNEMEQWNSMWEIVTWDDLPLMSAPKPSSHRLLDDISIPVWFLTGISGVFSTQHWLVSLKKIGSWEQERWSSPGKSIPNIVYCLMVSSENIHMQVSLYGLNSLY